MSSQLFAKCIVLCKERGRKTKYASVCRYCIDKVWGNPGQATHHDNAPFCLLQLYFHGKLNSYYGFIAVGGLYITPGYCEIQPPDSNRGEYTAVWISKNRESLVHCREEARVDAGNLKPAKAVSRRKKSYLRLAQKCFFVFHYTEDSWEQVPERFSKTFSLPQMHTNGACEKNIQRHSWIKNKWRWTNNSNI